jgi:peroxiredoxin Q/BCP
MQAPHFALAQQDGTVVDLDDLRGESLILFFFPRAGTAGCTREACDFRDRRLSLRVAGYRVMGISPDPVAVLHEFDRQERLDLTLLSDIDESCHRSYGAYGEKQRARQTVTGILRSTFVIDADSRITYVAYRVNPWNHVAELAAHLASPLTPFKDR